MVQAPSMVVGVDLVRVADVARSLERYGARYVRRIFTEREMGYYSPEPHLAGERYATRFAAQGGYDQDPLCHDRGGGPR